MLLVWFCSVLFCSVLFCSVPFCSVLTIVGSGGPKTDLIGFDELDKNAKKWLEDNASRRIAQHSMPRVTATRVIMRARPTLPSQTSS